MCPYMYRRYGVPRREVAQITQRVVDEINRTLLPKWVAVPRDAARIERMRAGFEARCGLPNVVGALTCLDIMLDQRPEAK